MAKVKIKWNVKAFEQVRKRSDAQAAVNDIARKIAAQCGDGYEVGTGIGRTRSRAAVITATGEAIRDNSKSNTILANINAGKR